MAAGTFTCLHVMITLHSNITRDQLSESSTKKKKNTFASHDLTIIDVDQCRNSS